MNSKRTIQRAALLVFLLLIAYSLAISHQVQAGENWLAIGFGGQVLTQYTLAFICMLIVWRSMQSQCSVSSIQLVLAVAVLARLLLIFSEPYTSNDVDRYLFDGRITVEGLDPYRTPHDAAVLEELRAQWAPPAEHAKYTTLYPPLALALFSTASATGLELAVLVWKLMTAAASLAVLALGYAVLKQAGQLKHLSLLALSPILILEAGEGLHLDVFSALAVLGVVYCWQRQRWLLIGICAGLGALIKMLPALTLLPVVFLLASWHRKFVVAGTAALTWAAGYGLAFALGLQPVGSVSVFFEKWRSGSPLFLWLEPHLSTTVLLSVLVLIPVIGFLAIAIKAHQLKTKVEQPHSDTALYSLMQLSMALPLLVTPVIFPWYLMPLLVLLALRPNVWLLLWAFALPMLYEVLDQFLCCQHWAPMNWPIHFIGVALMIGFIIDWQQKPKIKANQKQVIFIQPHNVSL